MTKHDVRLITEACRMTESLPGDLAEVGVWRGDSALVILRNTTGTLYLYDTFKGMPASMSLEHEHHKPGSFGDTSLELVQEKLSEYADRVVYRPGVFPETACDEGLFRLVHVDVDQYLSTKAVLNWFVPRMCVGGILILDDYACSTTPGARQATDEYVASHGGTLERVGARALFRSASR